MLRSPRSMPPLQLVLMRRQTLLVHSLRARGIPPRTEHVSQLAQKHGKCPGYGLRGQDSERGLGWLVGAGDHDGVGCCGSGGDEACFTGTQG